MFTPLSGVVAAHCDMAEMDVSSSNAVTPGAVMPVHDMSAMLSTETVSSEMSKHDCCDAPATNCLNACDLGMNISLVFPQTVYAPVYKNSFKSVSLSAKVLFRELTPPSRPPANFHS